MCIWRVIVSDVMSKSTKVAYVVSSEMTVRAFLINHLRSVSKIYDTHIITNTSDPEFAKRDYGLDVTVIPLDFKREISPLHDLRILFRLRALLKQNDYRLIHSVTPKSGLLGMIGGKLAGIPVRIHTFTGQVWVNLRGARRLFLKLMDRVTAMLASHVLVDSPSQRQFLVEQGVTTETHSTCLADGSISGVDILKFSPDAVVREKVRHDLGIPDDQMLVIFLGRLKKDKGVLDLAQAMARLSNDQVALLLVGPDEEGLEKEIVDIIGDAKGMVKFVPFTPEPEIYMKAADILCLPSYREGFGSVVIEAAACSVPTIGTRIYGITDSILDGKTGMLYEKGDINALASCIDRMVLDKPYTNQMGHRARARAETVFPQERLTAELVAMYDRQIKIRQ